MVREVLVGLVGWVLVATSFAAVYYLTRAVFFGGRWWMFVGAVAGTWALYRVAPHYQLEVEGGG